MGKSTTFRLSHSGLLLALIGAAFAGQAQAAAGRVEFTIGGATLSGANGQQRPLAKGTEVNSGDVLRTTDGRVQVRMADGAYISLQPNTEFGIKNYQYEGKTDGKESAFYSLLKGAMRTVTGLIGRVNRDRYQVATPTATVGIRGTGGVIQILDDGSTLVQGTSGIWFLSNPSGSIDVPAGVSGLSPSEPGKPPQESGEAPVSGPAPLPPEQVYVQGDQTNSDGTTVIEPTTEGGSTTPSLLTSGSGYAVATAFEAFSSVRISLGTNATAVFSGANLIDVDFADPLSGGKFVLSGTVNEVGNDGIIAWGRWTGDVSQALNICEGSCGPASTTTYGPNQGLHYVIGSPTVSMPTVGSATYTLLGATAPTYLDGRSAPGTLSGSLSVNFSSFTVGVNLNAAMTDGKLYSIGGSAGISGNTIYGDTFSSLTVAGTGGACTSGCSALVQGFFAGAAAERAGLAYHVNDFIGGQVLGAAAFTKQ